MSKIAKFYENLQKSFRPKNTKKAAQKATSVFLASLLTITYISSSRFNENAQIEAAAKWLAGIETETPAHITATLEGEYNPSKPENSITINDENYTMANLKDSSGNITLPSGTYKCKNFKVGTNARFKIKSSGENNGEDTKVTIWLEGNNEFQGKSGTSSSGTSTEKVGSTNYGGGASGGNAAIYLPKGASLYIRGSGNITATGGSGAKGINASNGCFIDLYAQDGSNQSINSISNLLYNDMNKSSSDVGTIGSLNSGAGTGAGGYGGGGGGSAIGTDGTDGGKGGKGFETYNDLNKACNKDLTSWLTSTGHDSDCTYGTSITISNKEGNGYSTKSTEDAGTVYLLSTGTINLTEGKGGEGGRAGQGMPNRNVYEKYRILGGGYGNFNNGRIDEDYNNNYMERKGGLRLILGGGGGGGGNGYDGKKAGAGGAGGGGGGAGGLGAAQYHLGFAEGDAFQRDKIKQICSNANDAPNNMSNNCPKYQDNNMYGHYLEFGGLVYHFNIAGDDAKIYAPFACNGGGGGGGGGGSGVGGGGAGGYINYFTRRGQFSSITPNGDYLNRATHASAYWTWRTDHYKDFAPNWGMGGDPYSSSTSYRTKDSPYVTTTSDYNIVKFRARDDWTSTEPLKFAKSTNWKITKDYDPTVYDSSTLHYVRSDSYKYYNSCEEPSDFKICKITNDSGRDGGNAVLRYRTARDGNVGKKDCSCYYNTNGYTVDYPIYPTAWGGEAGVTAKDDNGGTGGAADNVAHDSYNYYNQEWRQYDDGNGMHSVGPGTYHQAVKGGRDLVGVGRSAEGFSGNNGGNRANQNTSGQAYHSSDSNCNVGTELLDISKMILEIYMSDNYFTLRTNQKINKQIFWTIDGEVVKDSYGKSQLAFKEEYIGKKIGLGFIPSLGETAEGEYIKYDKDKIYYGEGTEAETKQKMCSYSKDDTKLEFILVEYEFNFLFKECDWKQNNELLKIKEDSATSPGEGEDKQLYPFYEAKYTSTKITPQLEFSYSDIKLSEGINFYLNYYLAKTSDDNSTWTKVDPQGKVTGNDVQPIVGTIVKNEGTGNEEITTAEYQLEDMSQYCKTPTASMVVGDRIVVEFIPKKGFPEKERDIPQVLFTYRIAQTDLSEDEISINLSPDTITYDGTDHNNDAEKENFNIGVYVKNIFRKLNKEEFEITWPEGPYQNVGTYSLKICPKTSTGFKGEAEASFKIIPYDIGCKDTPYKLELNQTEFDFVNSNDPDKWPKPTVKIVKKDEASSDPLLLGENDYVIEYYDMNEDGSYSSSLTKKAGQKVVIVKGKNPYSYDKESTENADCNFTGMLSATYKVNGTNIDSDGISVSLSPESFTYNGKEQKPEIIITKETNGITTSLKENTDYTVTWEENGDYTNAGTKKIIVKGIGENGFTGEKELTYQINKVAYDPDSSDWQMTVTPDNFYYNGTKLVPKVTVKYKGTTLEENTDYTLEYSDDSIDAGDKVITVKLKGNYTGEKELKYKIYNVSYNTTYGDGLDISLPEILSKDYDLSNADLEIKTIANSEGTAKSAELSDHIYIEGKNLKIGTSAPASNYVISINDKNNTIFPFYINLSVAKAIPELSIKDKTAVYTSKGITIDDITLKFKNNENFGEIKDIVSFDYYTDKECTSLVKDTPVNVGTYYVKAYVKAPSANYENVTSNVATLTIQKATQNLTGSKSYSGYPGSWIQIDTKTDANTKLTYKSSDDSIVQVDSEGKMLLMKDGTTTVTTTAEGTENYESATFEATVVVDKTLNKITAGDKTITDTIENNNSGNNGGTSGGNNGNNSSNSGGSSSGSSSSSSENNSSQNNSSSQGNGSSNSEQTQEEEKKSGLPLVADKFWSTILTTGDKSIYIISIAMVSIAIALTILIVLKRKDKDE